MTNYNTPERENGYGTAVLVLGIISIVFAVLLPIIAYLALLAGLIVSLVANSKNAVTKRLRTGQLLMVIGLVLAVINSALGVIVGLQ